MAAYYNEIDPFAAAWLRELIKAGHIAPGIVDERSIIDVRPDELSEFRQCHFFAGIGVWSYALRNAGWPDGKPVWTGSCPCQPFSAAGKGGGFDDERHLWPYWQWLIEQCKPTTVFGEQVASKSTGPWFDLVQADLEGMGYAFGCVPFPAAGVGAPHIRDRAYWVAYPDNEGPQRRQERGNSSDQRAIRESGLAGGMANANGNGCESGREAKTTEIQRQCPEREREHKKPKYNGELQGGSEGLGSASGLAKPNSNGREEGSETTEALGHRNTSQSNGSTDRPGPTNGYWRDVDWLGCRDGKWRPVKPGLKPLVDGTPRRVAKLRGFGNAINAEAAKVFIKSVM